MYTTKEHKQQQSRVIQNIKNSTSKVIQMRVFSMDFISDIEKRLNIKNIPILVMREYAIDEYYNCEYKEAVKYLDSFKEKHRLGCVSSGWLDENQGGGGYCSSTKCVLLSCSANNRTLAHELGHAKQDRFLGATIENIDADFLEAHNIIVNENLFNEFTYPNSPSRRICYPPLMNIRVCDP